MILEPLSLPGTPEHISQIMDFVTWSASAAGLDEAAAYRLSLAVDEIATNIIIHGYGDAGLTGNLTVWAEIDERLRIYLEDTGEPFDPRDAPRPENLDLPLEERGDGGLGIYLALWGVDDFAYERIGDTNRCIFVMNRPDPDAGAGEIAPASPS
jgi:anti-sigma regulatory factor (Ser/Thr protein kinase)